MPEPSRKRELGRGERVLPGVWRLRLPLPWPGVPHCNAWAIAASGSCAARVMCSWFGCIHSSQPVRSMIVAACP
jgi:hypothetical protein